MHQWPEGAFVPTSHILKLNKRRGEQLPPSEWPHEVGGRPRRRDISDKKDLLLDGMSYRFRPEKCFTKAEKNYPYVCPHCRLANTIMAFPGRQPFLRHLRTHSGHGEG